MLWRNTNSTHAQLLGNGRAERSVWFVRAELEGGLIMKRILGAIMAMCLAATLAVPSVAFAFIDEDGDGICDNCVEDCVPQGDGDCTPDYDGDGLQYQYRGEG